MRTITVKTDHLLGAIQVNKAKHMQQYEEAVAGYKAAAITKLIKATDKIRQQIESLKDGEMIQVASIRIDLPVPEDHSADYDRVIAMLQMSVDDEIEIENRLFAQYVMDDWDWSQDFKTVSGMYK